MKTAFHLIVVTLLTLQSTGCVTSKKLTRRQARLQKMKIEKAKIRSELKGIVKLEKKQKKSRKSYKKRKEEMRLLKIGRSARFGSGF